MQHLRSDPKTSRGLIWRRLAVGAAIALASAALILLVAPSLLRGPLTQRLHAALDAQLGATVRFDEVQVQWWRTFPHLSVTLHDLSVTNHAPFEGVKLARVEAVSAEVDLRSLFGDSIDLRGLHLLRPVITVHVDEQGRWNTDLFPSEDAAEEPEATTSSFALSLQSYTVEGMELTFEDRQAPRAVRLSGLDHRGRGDLTAQTVHLDTHTSIHTLTVQEGGLTLLRDAQLDWALDLTYDAQTGAVQLRENALSLNALSLKATGEVQPEDEGWRMALSLDAPGASFKDLLSLIPNAWIEGFEQVQADGTVALGGTVEGVWRSDGSAWPALDLALSVSDGSFQYPELPAGVDGVQLQAKIAHPGGPWELLGIDVPRFALRVDGQPVEGRLAVREVGGDPRVEAQIRGQVDLGLLASALPSDGRQISGRVDLDIDLGGRLSDFEAQRIEAVRATGTVKANGVTLDDPALGAPWHLDALDATLDPRWIEVASLKVRTGESDASGTLRLDNLLSWLLKGETLVGRGTMHSDRLDLDALYPDSGDPEEESSELYTIPEGLDLRVALQMDHLTYGGRDYRGIRGDVHAIDGSLRLENLQMNLLDGQMVLDGSYRALSSEQAELTVSVDLADLGLAGLLDSFETLRRLVPVAQKAPGRLNSKVNLKLRLGPDLSPDLSSLLSYGRIELFGVALRPNVLSQVQQTLKAANVNAVQLEESALTYDLRDGKMQLEPLPLRLGPFAGTLTGGTGLLDRSLDLRIALDVPVDQLAAGLLPAAASAGTVDVGLRIGGTYDQPTLRPEIGDVAGQIKDRLIDEVEARVDSAVGTLTDRASDALAARLAEAEARAEALLATAQTQADRLVAEAKRRADQLRAQAAQEGDRLIAAAEGKPLQKAAAQQAAKKLRDGAEVMAKQVESEAEAAANAAMRTAREQADALLAEAGATLDNPGRSRR